MTSLTKRLQPDFADCALQPDETPQLAQSMVVPRSSTIPFSALYEEHFDFVWRNAVRLLGLDCAADDITQEVFLTAFRRLDDFEGRSSPRTWLFGILRNIVRTHRRSKQRRGALASTDVETIVDENTGGQVSSLEKAQAIVAMHNILAALDDNKREVFVLFEMEEMAPADIAQATGTNLTTVHGRLRDARKIVAALVEKQRKAEGKKTP